METRVIILDGEQLVRRGIAEWLEAAGQCRVVAEAENAEQCLKLEENTAADVLLVDLHIPGTSALELITQLKEGNSPLRCIVLSGAPNPELVFQAYEAGASGYLPKQSSPEELTFAIAQVMKGNWYLSSFVSDCVLKHICDLRHNLARRGDLDGIDQGLTARERELLKLIAEGHTFTEIATRLSVNSRSVERLKTKLESKLGAQGITDLIREAIKLGIVQA